MPVGKAVRSLLDPESSRSINRLNIQRVMPEDSFLAPELQDPAAISKESRLAEAKGNEASEDAARYYGAHLPHDSLQQAVLDYGANPEIMRAFRRGLYDSMQANPTKAFDNSITSGLRTSYTTAPVASPKLGEGGKTAVTLAAPRQLLDNLTGDPAHAQRLLDRIQERNLPSGQGGAEIYHLDDVAQTADDPWLIFRDMGNKFGNGGDSAYASAPGQTVFINRHSDPGLDAPKRIGASPFNVSEHEAIHTILHPKVWTPEFQMRLDNRPAVLDIASPLLNATSTGRYLGSKSTELQNALFHAKRMTENVSPSMRDVGESMDSLDGFLEHVRQFQPDYADPKVNRPGHYLEGQPARGYNALMQSLQHIMRSLGPDGQKDLRDMNFKTGEATPIRKALLA